jgi:hypothetical protein
MKKRHQKNPILNEYITEKIKLKYQNYEILTAICS